MQDNSEKKKSCKIINEQVINEREVLQDRLINGNFEVIRNRNELK